MDLIISVFISLKGANNAIYCLFVKELDPNIMIGHKKKILAEAFFGHDQPSNEKTGSSYSSDLGWGRGCGLNSGQPSANQQIQRKKTFLQMLLVIHRAK